MPIEEPPSLNLKPGQVEALLDRLELTLAPLNRCLTRTVKDRLGSPTGFALAEQDGFRTLGDELSIRLYGILLHALVPEECGKGHPGSTNTVQAIRQKFQPPDLLNSQEAA